MLRWTYWTENFCELRFNIGNNDCGPCPFVDIKKAAETKAGAATPGATCAVAVANIAVRVATTGSFSREGEMNWVWEKGVGGRMGRFEKITKGSAVYCN